MNRFPKDVGGKFRAPGNANPVGQTIIRLPSRAAGFFPAVLNLDIPIIGQFNHQQPAPFSSLPFRS